MTRDSKKVTSLAEAKHFAAKYGLAEISPLIMHGPTPTVFGRSKRGLLFRHSILAMWYLDTEDQVIDSHFDYTTKLDLDGTRRKLIVFLFEVRARSGE
jgi:hypothetical protein